MIFLSYNTPSRAAILNNVRYSICLHDLVCYRQTISINTHSMLNGTKSFNAYICILMLVICKKYLCIVALKLLYTLFVRDMGYNRWNTHINMLFSWLPLIKKTLSRKICLLLVLTGHDQFLCVICERATYEANIMENIHKV